MSETNQQTTLSATDKKFGRSGMAFILNGLKSVFLQIKNAVKSVNNVEADENGNIPLSVVPFAQGLESDTSQRRTGAFIIRMSGGEASIESGDAWLLSLMGRCIHEGFVAEVLNMVVTAVERAEPITATFDPDTFKEYVLESGTTTLVYTTDWSEDPALYGVTVSGTPVSGDVITITYVKEERGEILVSNPTRLVATGWNLYNYTDGYARVVKYAHGYQVAGTYTSLQYSATLTGAKSEIVVTSGNFDIPDDGYVWVNGGDSSTEIYATWDDWTEGPDGDHEQYSESVINLATVMASKFPYGLLQVGTVADEIDLNLGQAISRIERMAYSEANRAIAAASGRDYIFDEDNIYLVRASAQTSTIEIDGSIQVNDHGIEYFEGTDAPVEALVLYGNNLKNKLERDVLTISPQELTAAQKAQVRSNIGAEEAAGNVTDISSSAWTWGNSYTTGDSPSVSFLALGRLRMLRCTITPKNTSTTWVEVGTIAAAHKPPHYLSTYACESVTTPSPKHVRIKSDGVCEIYRKDTSTYSFNFVWFV